MECNIIILWGNSTTTDRVEIVGGAEIAAAEELEEAGEVVEDHREEEDLEAPKCSCNLTDSPECSLPEEHKML